MLKKILTLLLVLGSCKTFTMKKSATHLKPYQSEDHTTTYRIQNGKVLERIIKEKPPFHAFTNPCNATHAPQLSGVTDFFGQLTQDYYAFPYQEIFPSFENSPNQSSNKNLRQLMLKRQLIQESKPCNDKLPAFFDDTELYNTPHLDL